MMLASVMAVVAASIFFVLFVRMKDIPAPEPVSPTKHLEERKAAIYENLRDLQFEYRVGKLSDEDYQKTKQGLQRELAGVIAEMKKITDAIAAGEQPPTSQAGTGPGRPSNQEGTRPSHAAQGSVVPASSLEAAAAVAAEPAAEPKAEVKEETGTVCPHCGAKFAKPMKFCGECGKGMSA